MNVDEIIEEIEKKERIGIFVGNFDLMFIIFFFRIVEIIINLNFIWD